jgi:tRNA threonylcarbamoyladenosine modification (KEOPS) complex Cgi121 subunit
VDDVLEKLNQYCDDKKCEAQIIDAEMVFGNAHILSAYEHAERAFNEGRNSSNSLATEVLLYASGERQISAAIEKMGIKDITTRFCVLLLGDGEIDGLIEYLDLKKDDSVLEGDAGNLEAFGISSEEMGTVQKDQMFDLVLERVAIVDLLK